VSFYSSISSYYDTIFPLSEDQLQFIESKAHPINQKNILEIGCGTGNLALALAERGATVSGIDYSDEMVTIANTNLSKSKQANIIFQKMDMNDIHKHFIKNSFDIIVCFGNTLPHLDNKSDLISFITKCHLLLKKNGKLLIQLVNYDWVAKHKIESLPTKNNTEISFERKYRKENNKIRFDTTLTLKETHSIIQNSELLLPIYKADLVSTLKDHLFSIINYYGDFTLSDYSDDKNGLVIEACV